MRTSRILFSGIAAFCLMISCLAGPVFAQGGPGGGGGNGGGGGGGGGNGGGGGGKVATGITLASQLTDIWQGSPTLNTVVKFTLNANGTFTLTETTTNAGKATIVTVQGNWTLGPATNLQPFSNPQGLLTLTSKGQVLLSGNVLLINPDLFQIFVTANNLSSFTHGSSSQKRRRESEGPIGRRQ